jgi:hypothetical protein
MKKILFLLLLSVVLIRPVKAQDTGIGVGLSFDVEYIMPQRYREPGGRTRALFPVKYVCGETQPTDRLVPGTYRTVINVLNLSTFATEVGWRFSSGFGRPGIVGARARIERFGSFFMDCPFIIRNLQRAGVEVGSFIEGFVTIEDLNDSRTERTPTRVAATYSVLHKQVHNLPDLLPIQRERTWCRLDNQGRLIVTIRNQGEASAPLSITRVAIDAGASFSRITPTLAPGSQADLAPIPLPSGEGTVVFTITADAPAAIREMNETNNSAIGVCVLVE